MKQKEKIARKSRRITVQKVNDTTWFIVHPITRVQWVEHNKITAGQRVKQFMRHI